MSIITIEDFKGERNSIFSLLQQLTNAQILNLETFNNIIKSVSNDPNHNIYVYVKDNKAIGMITLLIEQKLIHNGKCVGHIEDLVVDKNNNGQGIAQKLLTLAIQIAKNNNCYKIILDCDKNMVSFYEKTGFKEKGIQMGLYF